MAGFAWAFVIRMEARAVKLVGLLWGGVVAHPRCLKLLRRDSWRKAEAS